MGHERSYRGTCDGQVSVRSLENRVAMHHETDSSPFSTPSDEALTMRRPVTAGAIFREFGVRLVLLALVVAVAMGWWWLNQYPLERGPQPFNLISLVKYGRSLF